MVLGARNVEGADEIILKVFNFKLAKILQNITISRQMVHI
jgi:hypothetical protein